MKYFKMAFTVSLVFLFVISCQKDVPTLEDPVPQIVIDKLTKMGFNPDGIIAIDEGYLIERDIVITYEFLKSTPNVDRVPGLEHYRTINTVSTGGNRTVTVYLEEEVDGGGNPGGMGGSMGGMGSSGSDAASFGAAYGTALDEAIVRYNAENLDLTFSRVSTSTADIVFTRLGKGQERQGILGSAGFPSNGDPYGEIKMSGILQSTYGLSTDGIATIMAHELGHCIGLRHTDYFDRSISCGSGGNEGDGGVGAIHINGTPTTNVNFSDQSFMLSCTSGNDRPFNNNDQTALGWMYKGNY